MQSQHGDEMDDAREFNFDGIVGPTHNYSGLSHGNLASTTHGDQVSNPREAAAQGLEKMKLLCDLGVAQAVFPPQERPNIDALRRLGFCGRDAEVLARAAKESPALLANCSSASSMWTANAATVAPSADTADGKVHFTPANLSNKLHRTLEVPATAHALKTIFSDPTFFVHHEALPAGDFFGDEGAANHTRLCAAYGKPGVHLFVYGRTANAADPKAPKKFPARQTLEASQAIARLHRLEADRDIFARQNPAVIDAGVFHNDVISVGNRDLFFFHERAFDSESTVAELSARFAQVTGQPLRVLKVPEAQVSVEAAVKSYLFNSQLVEISDGKMALIAPRECEQNEAVKSYLESLRAPREAPIAEFRFPDLRQSMHNGGGPACLRLRVVLTSAEAKSIGARVFLDAALYLELKAWIETHYRDRLRPADLGDPELLDESRVALDRLTQILRLGSLYPFQRSGPSTSPSAKGTR